MKNEYSIEGENNNNIVVLTKENKRHTTLNENYRILPAPAAWLSHPGRRGCDTR